MNLDWPPVFSIRHSTRAKRINLRLCPERGLTLTVPKRTSEKTALEFLDQQKAWVFKHQHLLQPKPQTQTLPEIIELFAINKIWKLRYEKISGYKKIKLLQLPNELVLYGEDLELQRCLHELKEWLYMTAQKEFSLWLKQLSVQCDLPFKQLSVRNQSTRWGSCSYEKNINLNIKLLFLPRAITHYILIHELCHTKHLNHSAKFWHLVESFVPDYRSLKLQLKQIKHADFPRWVD